MNNLTRKLIFKLILVIYILIRNNPLFSQNHIFFDLGGVLLQTSKIRIIAKLGPKCFFYPNIYDRFFEFILFIDDKSVEDPEDSLAQFKGKKLPSLFCKWQKGELTCYELVNYIINSVDKYPEFFTKNGFIKKSEQKLIKNSAKLILPDNSLVITKKAKDCIKLLTKCKNKKDKRDNNLNQLYIISNFDINQLKLIKQKYPELFNIFDDNKIIISSEIKMMKPNKNIFNYVIKKFKLNPDSCILIDDQKENISSAEQCGINGILHSNMYNTYKQLKLKNII